MKSFSGLLASLVIKILFLEVGKWSNSEAWASIVPISDYGDLFGTINTSSNNTSSNDKDCSKLISRQETYYEPYVDRVGRQRGCYYDEEYDGLWNYRWNHINYRLKNRTVTECICSGYSKVGHRCEPHCAQPCLKNEYCSAPNKCTCKEGYKMSYEEPFGRNFCEPVCTNGCINGTCIEPNICSCNLGHWLNADGITCDRICPEECIKNNGHCAEPHVCSCLSGYKETKSNLTISDLITSNLTKNIICEPICDKECINGQCTQPNTCKCADGYKPDAFDRFRCNPVCSEVCINGTCVAPETCECIEGYSLAVNGSRNVCEPKCNLPCKNGVCIAPNFCKCNKGYRFADKFSSCQPSCDDCPEDKCIAPECDFLRTTQVVPRCEIPCGQFGKCTSPNNCTCEKGYQAVYPNKSADVHKSTIKNSYICQPVCNVDCSNGDCTSPDICTCHSDYIRSYNRIGENGTLKPICKPKCDAFCIVFYGYEAICIDPSIPYKCGCKDGYKKMEHICERYCSQDACLNGVCKENRCVCNDGYMLRENVCKPVCTLGSSGECICYEKYLLKNNKMCIPACIDNCSGHGACVTNSQGYKACKCHFGWTGFSCDEPTMCLIGFDDVNDNINKITIRNDTNSTIIRAHKNAPHCDRQCANSLNKESFCYVIRYDKTNETVGCLLSTANPCKVMSHYNAASNVTEVAWVITVIAILIATSLSVAVYVIYRKRQRKRMAEDNSNSLQHSVIKESLLPEDDQI